jgi:hypothetical protein
MRDPYELLAVSRSATAQDIKKAFRARAKRLHPDANNNDPKAAALFAELNAAHEILGDEEKRAAFDHGVIDAEGKPTRQMNASANRRRRRILTCLMVAVVMLAIPLVMRALTPEEGFIANTDGKAGVWPRLGADEEHVAQTPRQRPYDKPEPHLILRPSSYYSVDGSVPLGIQVNGEAAGLVLEIGSLPTGMRISSGRPVGDRWRILATDLGGAMIRPPPGFSGTVELAVELQFADETVVDRALFRLQWQRTPTSKPTPIETASNVARSDSSQAIATAARTDAEAISQRHHGQIEFLLGRSQEPLSEFDAGEAGVLLQPSANAATPRLAAVLGATNAAIMLSILQDRDVSAEVSLAGGLYEKPGVSNSRQTQKRLIAAWTPIVSDNAHHKATPTPAPKRRGVRIPTQPLARPQDPNEGHVEGIGADLNPLPLPPAFLR